MVQINYEPEQLVELFLYFNNKHNYFILFTDSPHTLNETEQYLIIDGIYDD